MYQPSPGEVGEVVVGDLYIPTVPVLGVRPGDLALSMKRFVAVLLTVTAMVGPLAGRSEATWVPGDAAALEFPPSLLDTRSDKLDSLRDVACVAVGECVAAGEVRIATGAFRAFVVTMSGGVWGTPQAVDFPGQLSVVSAEATALDCVTGGECALIGSFLNAVGDRLLFGAFMTGGVWSTAQQILTPAAVVGSNPAYEIAGSVSCSAPGFCVFSASTNTGDPWYTHWVAVTSSPGVIGQGTLVAFGSGAAASPPKVVVDGISCVVSGPCTIFGSFDAPGPLRMPFAADYSAGTWSNAEPITIGVPHTGAWSGGGDCVAPGECVMVGRIETASGSQSITMVRTGGVWGAASVVPLPPNPAASSDSVLVAVSCPSVGTCTAIGYHYDAVGEYYPWSLHMSGGSWGSPVVLPRFPGSVETWMYRLDCGADGVCVASGSVTTDRNVYLPFTVGLWGGVWGTPALMSFPALGTVPPGDANAISCVGTAFCVVVGYHYPVPQGVYQAFSMSLVPAPPAPVGPAYTG